MNLMEKSYFWIIADRRSLNLRHVRTLGPCPEDPCSQCSSYPRSLKLISIPALEHFDPDQLSRVMHHASCSTAEATSFHSIAFRSFDLISPMQSRLSLEVVSNGHYFLLYPSEKDRILAYIYIYLSTPSCPLFHTTAGFVVGHGAGTLSQEWCSAFSSAFFLFFLGKFSHLPSSPSLTVSKLVTSNPCACSGRPFGAQS